MNKSLKVAALYAAVFGSITLATAKTVSKNNPIKFDVQAINQDFNTLSKQMNVGQVADAIVAHDSAELKKALEDIMNLNRIISAQVNVVVQSWNQYQEQANGSSKTPSKEAHLMNNLMSSCVSALRSLSLRSNVDQAMILSLIKKDFIAPVVAKVAQPSKKVSSTQVKMSSYAKAPADKVVKKKSAPVHVASLDTQVLHNHWNSLTV